eukprot:TRINITY_DN17148_c0_g1_i1.p1 TRINITY_DN17148_c0_g1~~TRINITY_DN17148_c0_g1_i1.p1  ORF type:complete len:339 (+),score=92.87 TRINITY_DN17148_c0_g1_i1:50-1066(+)
MDPNKIKEEQNYRKELEEIEKLKRSKFIQENSAKKKNIVVEDEEDDRSPNYTESFRHHIVPFSQVIIKSPENTREGPIIDNSIFPFLQPANNSQNNNNVSLLGNFNNNNKNNGDIELSILGKNSNQLLDDFRDPLKKYNTLHEESITIDEGALNTPKLIKGGQQKPEKKKNKAIMRIRRSFGMTTKESPYKFVFDDYVHHNVFYLPICITALAGMVFLIIAKLLSGYLIFNIIGIILLIFTPLWFVMMRTRTVKIDIRSKTVERRTTRCCLKSIDKFQIDNIKSATMKYYSANHMIVLEANNNSIIEVSLTADAFNHQLKEETCKQFNVWFEKAQHSL